MAVDAEDQEQTRTKVVEFQTVLGIQEQSILVSFKIDGLSCAFPSLVAIAHTCATSMIRSINATRFSLLVISSTSLEIASDSYHHHHQQARSE
jgi:hypothetical protein